MDHAPFALHACPPASRSLHLSCGCPIFATRKVDRLQLEPSTSRNWWFHLLQFDGAKFNIGLYEVGLYEGWSCGSYWKDIDVIQRKANRWDDHKWPIRRPQGEWTGVDKVFLWRDELDYEPMSQPWIPTQTCQGHMVTTDLLTLGTSPNSTQSGSTTQKSKGLWQSAVY
jgi:hypothetical protein